MQLDAMDKNDDCCFFWVAVYCGLSLAPAVASLRKWWKRCHGRGRLLRASIGGLRVARVRGCYDVRPGLQAVIIDFIDLFVNPCGYLSKVCIGFLAADRLETVGILSLMLLVARSEQWCSPPYSWQFRFTVFQKIPIQRFGKWYEWNVWIFRRASQHSLNNNITLIPYWTLINQ